MCTTINAQWAYQRTVAKLTSSVSPMVAKVAKARTESQVTQRNVMNSEAMNKGLQRKVEMIGHNSGNK